MNDRLMIVGGIASSLVNFRGKLIESMTNAGADVVAVAPNASDETIRDITALGARFVEIRLSRLSTAPWSLARTLVDARRLLRAERPDVVLAYTIVPIVAFGLVTRIRRREDFVALVTGLGIVLRRESRIDRIRSKALLFGYKHSLRRAKLVFFQNSDDMADFLRLGIASDTNARLVAGSGVDLEHFTHQPLPDGAPVVLFVGRMMESKGVVVLRKAATLVRREMPEVTFKFVGPIEPSSDGVDEQTLIDWSATGDIDYVGPTDDVRQAMRDCHLFVLPSYYGEGIPRTILEAMATGRAVIAADWRGSRQAVVDGKNGFLVEPRNHEDLAAAILSCLGDRSRLEEMAIQSRQLAESEFDVDLVNQHMLSEIERRT